MADASEDEVRKAADVVEHHQRRHPAEVGLEADVRGIPEKSGIVSTADVEGDGQIAVLSHGPDRIPTRVSGGWQVEGFGGVAEEHRFRAELCATLDLANGLVDIPERGPHHRNEA